MSKATEPVERTHWHILWLVKEGQTPRQVAEQVGYSAGWIREVVRRWNEAGRQGIKDHRWELPGAKPLLSLDEQKELATDLEQPPPKVAIWMQHKVGRTVDPRRGRDYLQRLGYSSRVPRPQHTKAHAQQQAAFKNLPEEVEEVRHAHPEAAIEVWSADEHRIGLKPIPRRVWARKGTTVKAVVAQRYQWMYVYAFVHPESGQTTWLLLPMVSIEAFSLALQLFAQEVGARPDKQVMLLLDRAGWHTSQQLTTPAGLHLLFLSPYSPELQPAERLWPLSNEPLANRSFSSLDELEQVQAERCRYLQTHPALIRAQTLFHWWPVLNTS